MARTQQIKLNGKCLICDILLFNKKGWRKILFHFKGIVRAIRGEITLK